MADTAPKPGGGAPPPFGQRDPGFVSHVEPVWLALKNVKSQMKFFEHMMEKRKLKKRVRNIQDQLARMRVPDTKWHRSDGKRISHVRIARTGLLQNLRDFVSKSLTPAARGKLTHFLRHREWNSYYIPVDFPEPFSVRGAGREVIPVGSSVQLQKELWALDQVFNFQNSVPSGKLALNMTVSEKDITMFDSENDDIPDFWEAFVFGIMIRLVEESLKHDLPIIFP